jgi:hypothetical protein
MGTHTDCKGSRLLIAEEPLQVLPSLAVAVGLNEAIILQQMHYWLKRSEHIMEGQHWIYNTYIQWRQQFPFWGLNTIKRAVSQLEKLGILISTSRFNRNPIDKTKWYRIDYQHLETYCHCSIAHNGSSSTHNGSSMTHNGSTTTQIAPFDDPLWVDSQRDPQRDLTEILNPPPSVPLGGSSDMKRKVVAKQSSNRSRLQRAHFVPPEFVVTEHMTQWAKEKCPDIDLTYQTALFMQHEFDKPRSDWSRTWMSWMLRACHEFAPARPARKKTTQDYQDGYDALIAEYSKKDSAHGD